MRGLFVTGTGTGVGKTVLSAALVLRYRHRARFRYWKPIQTGIDHDDDTATVRKLASCGREEILDRGVRLHSPVSPHLAARRAGMRIDLQHLIDLAAEEESLIVEGAGGVLVPVNESETMADFMKLLGLPVLVAAQSGLGTINHTLLTLEALRARYLQVAGVVMVGGRNPDNRLAIEGYGGIGVLGEMPRFEPLTAERLARWAMEELDPENRLAEFLA